MLKLISLKGTPKAKISSMLLKTIYVKQHGLGNSF